MARISLMQSEGDSEMDSKGFLFGIASRITPHETVSMGLPSAFNALRSVESVAFVIENCSISFVRWTVSWLRK